MTGPSPHLTFADVAAAADRIRPYVHRTPVATSTTLDAELGARVFFKCENLQKVGAFKARGALNAVLSLDAEAAARGVVAHSSGNHSAALAYAARVRGIPCHVVMPHRASPLKVAATRRYGGVVTRCDHARREEAAEEVRAATGAVPVHPFDDPLVMAGQGTAALELLEEVGDLDVVVAPIGGGGLLSGTAVAVRRLAPGARLVGVEPEAVDDAFRSLQTGVRQPGVPDPSTLADGLLTGLGARPFDVLRWAGAEVVTVSEHAIVTAARDLLFRMKLVVEPSGAVALAGLRELGDVAGARVGVILSGGNTDFAWLER